MQTGKAKSAVADTIPFLMLVLLYSPVRQGQIDAVRVEGTKRRNRRELQNWRSARRGCAGEIYRGRKNRGEKFKPVYDGNDGQVQRLSGNSGACRGAKLTGMRAAGPGIQIGTKVELRREEDHSEQQGTKP